MVICAILCCIVLWVLHLCAVIDIKGLSDFKAQLYLYGYKLDVINIFYINYLVFLIEGEVG